jgi:hypothetical protein
MEDESRKARQRYDTIVSLIEGDSTSSELLGELINSAKQYVGHLEKIQIQRDSMRFRLESRDFTDLMVELDSIRSRYHGTLTSNLIIFNRYLLRNHPSAPLGGICPRLDNPDEIRYAAAEWAKELVDCLEN